MTKIRPNQIRAFSNSQGNRSYYIVVQDGKGKLGAMWFRHTEGSPLHISWKFKMLEEHDLIMEDCNKLKAVFSKIDNDLYGDEVEEEIEADSDAMTMISLTVDNTIILNANFIAAIKCYRAATGDGLKESKAVLDLIKTVATTANIKVKMSRAVFDIFASEMYVLGVSITGS